MPSREVTLRELWQTCRACEDSCRRIADVIGAIMRQADDVDPQPHIVVDPQNLWPVPLPDPPCVPPFCQISLGALAERAEWLARGARGVALAVDSLREQAPDRNQVIAYYTCVPGGPDPYGPR
jgi:hypothetical protein